MEGEKKGTKNCPFCAEEIALEAKKCKHCGEMLDPILIKRAENKKEWSPGVAAVLSLIIPGAGQMYKSQLGAGFIWLFAVVIGYALLVVPGLILHIICIIKAYSDNPYSK